VIADVIRSCDCSEVTLSADRVAPGVSGYVELVVDLGGESAREVTARVHSNDPARPVVQLHLDVMEAIPEGSGPALVDLDPGWLDLGDVNGTDAVRARVRVIQRRPDPRGFEVLSIVSPTSHLTAREVSYEPPGVRVSGRDERRFRALEVTLLPGLPLGSFDEEVAVVTNAGPPLALRVTGRVTRGINVDPPVLFFGVVQSGETPERSLTVTAPKSHAWKVRSSPELDKHLSWEIEQDDQAGRVEIRARLRDTAPPGLLSGHLALTSGELRVDVPVDAWVSP
jgi:hypothetical protein